MSPEESAGVGHKVGPFLILVLATLALFARVSGFEFVNYDDPSYVQRNPVVAQGLTTEGLAYAFRGEHSTNWHPLTTLSHMLDAEVFGVGRGSAGRHHLVNAALHALNAGLCFLALLALSGRRWVAFAAAALFALHPLRVESVAWISERKDVLSGVFFFLMLHAWARYAKKPGVLAYGLVLVLLSLGLMAKQMLLTVPFLLLLLDAWPLGRWRRPPTGLVLEKLGLLVPVAVAVALMFQAQEAGGTMGSTGVLPLADRAANAFGATFAYLRETLVPIGLAVFHPHPSIAFPGDAAALWGPAALGLVLVASLSWVAWRARRTQPALIVGWCWFLGMLVPVIGLVQIGSQAHADRYTYLPSVGLALALCTLAADLVERRPAWRRRVLALGALALVGCVAASWRQLGTWRDSETLHRHAIRVTERNFVAHNNLGLVHLEEGLDPVLAQTEFELAIRCNPHFREAVYNLAIAYLGQGLVQNAETTLETLLRMDPGYAPAVLRLGRLRAARGDAAGALAELKRAVALDDRNAAAWLELGELHLSLGQGVFAEEAAVRAIALDPTNLRAHLLHGRSALQLDHDGAALKRFQTAVDVAPESAEARTEFARQLANLGQLALAREEVEVAVELDDRRAEPLVILGKLLIRDDPAGARRELDRALALAPDHPEANELLGAILRGSDPAGAEAAYLVALRTDPGYTPVLYNLGSLYMSLGREREAVERYRQLLTASIDAPEASWTARDLAWILATSADDALIDTEEAVRWAEYAFDLASEEERATFDLWVTRAAAFAAAGRFEEAVAAQQEAVARSVNDAQRSLFEKRRELFASRQPFRRRR